LTAQQPALCLAIACTSNQQYANLKTQFAQQLNEKSAKYQVVGALCMGELGKRQDMSKEADLYKRIQSLINSDQEDVRSAASTALGKMSLGNTGFFLPSVMAMIVKADQKHKFLYLNAIKEIIVNNVKALSSDASELIENLINLAKHPEEKIRNIVAESMGRIYSEYSFEINDDLVDMLKNGDARQKATVA
jgi:HEAT repeat protein